MGRAAKFKIKSCKCSQLANMFKKKTKNTVKCTHSDPVLMLFQSHKSNSSGLEMKG